jgi:hypothetical protein
MATDEQAGPVGASPGIPWEPGEEDYPFAALPGEAALEYFQRWLGEAGYARLEHDGATYIHEADVSNLVNHITADVDLLRARVGLWGDLIVTAAEYAAAVGAIENGLAELRKALATLQDSNERPRP